MASLSKDGERGWRIRFRTPDECQRTIRLGACPKKSAETVNNMVDRLIVSRRLGTPPDQQVIGWLANIDDVLLGKLAAVALIEARHPSQLEAFLNAYVRKRTDVVRRTQENFQQAVDKLVEFFSPDMDISSVTEEDAHDFRRWLETPKPDGAGLAEATAAGHCKRAKQFFASAKRSGIILNNPFDGVRVGSQSNDERHYFVSREATGKLLAECRSNRQRLIVALARYGGLRIPSELVGLRWSEVDWEKGRMVVHSPKTKRHRGKECRVIPIWPEIRPYLERAWDEAEVGEDRILPDMDGEKNLRTWMGKLILRAGMTPWPRMWVNMRSSRATELAEEYPAHVCEAWLGHSEIIARKHYRQVTDEHFDRATADAQTAPELGHKSGHIGATNRTMQPHGISCNERQETTEGPIKQGPSHRIASKRRGSANTPSTP